VICSLPPLPSMPVTIAVVVSLRVKPFTTVAHRSTCRTRKYHEPRVASGASAFGAFILTPRTRERRRPYPTPPEPPTTY
jgi:hypothetical protein